MEILNNVEANSFLEPIMTISDIKSNTDRPWFPFLHFFLLLLGEKRTQIALYLRRKTLIEPIMNRRIVVCR